MMIKGFVVGCAFAAAVLTSAPAAVAEPDPLCLAAWGCVYEMDANGQGGTWICPEPGIYLLCDL